MRWKMWVSTTMRMRSEVFVDCLGTNATSRCHPPWYRSLLGRATWDAGLSRSSSLISVRCLHDDHASAEHLPPSLFSRVLETAEGGADALLLDDRGILRSMATVGERERVPARRRKIMTVESGGCGTPWRRGDSYVRDVAYATMSNPLRSDMIKKDVFSFLFLRQTASVSQLTITYTLTFLHCAVLRCV